jgi:hypothetical protein
MFEPAEYYALKAGRDTLANNARVAATRTPLELNGDFIRRAYIDGKILEYNVGKRLWHRRIKYVNEE